MRGSRWSQPGVGEQGRGRRLDNLALVPASLLSRKAVYQRLANQLPDGAVLVVLPNEDSPERHTLQETAARLRAKGHAVALMTVEEVLQPRRGRPPQPALPAALPQVPALPARSAAPAAPVEPPALPLPPSSNTEPSVIPAFQYELRLVRVDASATPARFEVLRWQPTLWGPAALLRVRGVLGQPGRQDIVVAAGTPESAAAVARLVRRRLRAGYAIADWQ